ncbi:ornithine decarboxylase-like [Herrania umbratica]|uniref:ornithine decarboxylase n=1 Tax=Herrania umbratica TaxID=108875 RepID=A0A6J1ADZ0_9ROSI|nr:ornithine decarboxylase-like [Herrania umbratica]
MPSSLFRHLLSIWKDIHSLMVSPFLPVDQSRTMMSSSRSLQPTISAAGLTRKRATALSENELIAFIQSVISDEQQTEPFYVLDLGVVADLFDMWIRNLPMVQPFYAVKCNPNPALLREMAALGSNFDCASRAEIEAVLALGVSPDRIVFANPCKAESHIKYAASVGVNLTTFDSKDELEKIRKWHPECALFIRIKPPETSGARFQLGAKFGALPEEVVPLLQAAQAAQFTVQGVSFHIGSGATHFRAFEEAIAAAKTVFEKAAQLGIPNMHILNIGGGFTAGPRFTEAAPVVKTALQKYFFNEPGLKVMAEPGLFFAQSSFTLVASIIGKRVRHERREYWINDGIYGSFNFLLYDHDDVILTPLACTSNRGNPTCKGLKTYDSTVFGPTCDAGDTVLKGHPLPEVQVNDWLVFHKMGAYTSSCGTKFNGFDTSAISTYIAYSDQS